MKLTPSQLGAKPESMLDAALRLAIEGWNVFPLSGKRPAIPNAHPKGDVQKGKCHGECGRDGHGAWDGTTDQAKIRRWWSEYPNANIGANCGEDKVVFDIDLNHGGRVLAAFPHTRTHYSGRGNGNRHLIYLKSGGMADTIKSWTGWVEGIDTRVGRGAYIVMPPSLHDETGKPYEDAGNDFFTLTDAAVERIFKEADQPLSATQRGAKAGLRSIQGGPASTGRSQLSDLLSNPPGEGGRNDWLIKVAGHYAKRYAKEPDLFTFHVEQANGSLPQPLEANEVKTVSDSAWNMHQDNHPEVGATLENGFLVGYGNRLECQTVEKNGQDSMSAMGHFANFDFKASGVAISEQGERTYWVQLRTMNRKYDLTLPASIFGDDRALKKRLAAFGAAWVEPYNASPKIPASVRLLAYIESQTPTPIMVADTLGWHAERNAFITHEGAITYRGAVTKEESGLVADPHLAEREIAPYHYGFENTWDEAQRVLNEVLTFQDETVTSVFGAWWAACLLRPQFQERTSLFPFFGVEAASESGKTNGFFAQMVALNGNTLGQTAPTRPVLRDYASANRNGIVWADDLDDLAAYGEILRASTSNGVASKMDLDRSGVRNTSIVAPILLTGEALGFGTQKALTDRALMVEVPSPKGRRSRHDETKSQWEDIRELAGEYPKPKGLTVLSGWYVQQALAVELEAMDALRLAQRIGSGRHTDKLAVIRAGARLLDHLCGHEGAWDGLGEHTVRVEAWARGVGAQALDQDNALTLEVLPEMLRRFGTDHPFVAAPMGRFQGIQTPCFMTDYQVDRVNGVDGLDDPGKPDVSIWYHLQHLADAWSRDNGGKVAARTHSPEALAQQSKALGKQYRKAFQLDWGQQTGPRRVGQYIRLPDQYVAVVMARAGVVSAAASHRELKGGVQKARKDGVEQ